VDAARVDALLPVPEDLDARATASFEFGIWSAGAAK